MTVVSPYSRTRNKQLVRVLNLLNLLQHARWTLSGVTRELSVSSRTVRRDFAAIEAAHLPLRTLKAEDGTRIWWLGGAADASQEPR